MLLWSYPAVAVELRPVKVVTGTKGLVPIPVRISNTGAKPLSCTAQLAHWYSSIVAIASPGAEAQIDLWFEPASGAYLILNGKQENMPVEDIWCGIAGRAYETRATIELERSIGATVAARQIDCAAVNDRLVCE